MPRWRGLSVIVYVGGVMGREIESHQGIKWQFFRISPPYHVSKLKLKS
jgi:hypothetical protein